jgi:hypothetical protein
MSSMTPLLEILSIISFRIRLNNYIHLQVRESPAYDVHLPQISLLSR